MLKTAKKPPKNSQKTMKNSHIPPKNIQKRVYEIGNDISIPIDKVKFTYYEIYKERGMDHNKAIEILRDRLLIKYFLPIW